MYVCRTRSPCQVSSVPWITGSQISMWTFKMELRSKFLYLRSFFSRHLQYLSIYGVDDRIISGWYALEGSIPDCPLQQPSFTLIKRTNGLSVPFVSLSCSLCVMVPHCTIIARCYIISFDMFPTRCNFTQFIYFWKTTLHVSAYYILTTSCLISLYTFDQ